MQKRFDEYFAKVVLESCFPKQFSDLEIADTPDLRCGNEIGIEVTNCMPQRVAEAFNLWHRVDKQGGKTPQRIIERLEQFSKVQRDEKGLIWTQNTYTDDIYNSPVKDFLDSAEKKVERLNSHNANYAKMNRYELFINSFILIPRHQIGEVIERLKVINSGSQKFDTIYLVTNEQKLLVFEMTNGTLQIKYLYSHLERMADKAIKLYKGEIDDQT